MRKTLDRCGFFERDIDKLWRRYGRSGLSFDDMLELKQHQLGGRLVFDSTGALISEERHSDKAKARLMAAGRTVTVASQRPMGHASEGEGKETAANKRFRMLQAKLQAAARVVAAALPSRDEEEQMEQEVWPCSRSHRPRLSLRLCDACRRG